MNRLDALTRRKGKRLESAATLQGKLNTVKETESETKKKFELLLMKKARISTNTGFNRQLENLNSEIKEAKAEIQDYPYRVAILTARLEEARVLEAVQKETLKDYKKSTSALEMKKKSMLLLKHLKVAQKINSELLELHRKRQRTEELTGRKIDAVGVCGAFYSLEVLVEFCEQENAGESRKATTWEKIPYQKI